MSTAAKAVKRPRKSDLKIVAKEGPEPVREPVAEKKPLKVLLCASEAMPFIKTGALPTWWAPCPWPSTRRAWTCG